MLHVLRYKYYAPEGDLEDGVQLDEQSVTTPEHRPYERDDGGCRTGNPGSTLIPPRDDENCGKVHHHNNKIKVIG